MELRVLRYFLAVARAESISKAAQTLHLTQPTLSRQLMELEQELGKPLLIRGSRRVTLTPDGLLLCQRAGEILELVEKTEAELQSQDTEIAGEIYLGGGESQGMQFLAHTARQLQQTCPHIRYHLFSGNAQDVGERLEQGRLDFGLMIGPAQLHKYHYLKLPFQDTWGVLMRRDCPLAEKSAVCPEDLWPLPLLLSRQAMGQDAVANWLGRDLSTLQIVATYNLIFNASLWVREGLGYALCLEHLVAVGEDTELCFRPLSPQLQMDLYLVWKKHQIFSPAAEAFLRQLQAQLQRQPPQPEQAAFAP